MIDQNGEYNLIFVNRYLFLRRPSLVQIEPAWQVLLLQVNTES